MLQPPLLLSAVPLPVLRTIQTLQTTGHQAVIVGGAVRDLFLHRPSHDWDVASSASPDTFLKIFPRCHPTGLKHGTVTVVEEDLPIEVTTFRGDGAYTDGRRPDDVRFGVTLEEDLSRRDFTINAMAWDPIQNILHDPFSGAVDLQKRLVRAVGEPLARFLEDGLRPMRAIRIATMLGFEVDVATLQAIPKTIEVFRKIALERVRDEFIKTLQASRPSFGLELFRQTGLLAEFLPELSVVAAPLNRYHSLSGWSSLLRSVDATVGSPFWRLATLLRDAAKPINIDATSSPIAEEIGRRLKLSADEVLLLSALVAQFYFSFDLSSSDAQLRRLIRRLGEPLLPALLSVRRGELLARAAAQEHAALLALATRFERLLDEKVPLMTKDLAANGEDLMRAGVPRGPKVGAVLRYLLERVIDEPKLNNREVLLSLLPEALSLV
jgi:tRNA nucleotidyltransferase (CCA-adding enzyme)